MSTQLIPHRFKPDGTAAKSNRRSRDRSRAGSRSPIDLLFTDVIMPGGVSGPALALATRDLAPSLRGICTSRYAENAIVPRDRLDAGIQLLSKPHTRADLALEIRVVVAGPV
jgi:hypothetical protein